MKLCVASHVVLDEIINANGESSESLGGPVCYGSLLAKTFGFAATPATKAGGDILPMLESLKACNVILKSSQIDKEMPTTRFRLVSRMSGGRDLFLLNRCSPIELKDIPEFDGIVISPVFNEISVTTLSAMIKNKNNQFIMFDPQGFLRRVTESNSVYNLTKLDLDLAGVTAIKADEEELSALTGGISSIDGMKILKKKFDIQFIISTYSNNILFLNKDILYTINLKKLDSPDHTGLGDILAAGFSCAYLKEKDPLWAICFGAGSVIAALQSKKTGLEKVPPRKNQIERNASYVYNTVKFKVID
ncbi:PfkB family carbohydrate kinase [Candidatus Nitrosocosmicus agrestis]|jgi:sugar/nucleoside kinase (ribokinase family)|uniref:PfkB family carbohydrate kinase n=1 Tax=Candidatus Nitrosocosmicus agrestis TaxID=2563600 RepID=UPI00122E5846|nr:PfkB family carbohydrate kinase [Candidatus Nitrosocosmicus sp. SS]KAA2279153.1 ribokinase [Candidatus Nitrosocosmicus sp. SS]KAF0867663.1 ribokinase [Candidatus Nitrosocosmicus sp. SS]